MRILYYSVHASLEDDEVRLLKHLGNEVCCLGVNGPAGVAESYRRVISFSSAELELYRRFEELGGQFKYNGDVTTHVIPDQFVELFDVVIVMHDLSFLDRFWTALSRRPVVWRTIGQNVPHFETIARPLRDRGLRIVRYSPLEERVPGYLGGEACIRFSKEPGVYRDWTGVTPSVLTFCGHYRQRYRTDAEDYSNVVAGLPAKLGGAGNEGMPEAIGMVSPEEQLALYQTSGCYLYASALDVPYTLNFIEAWMTGIPVVVHAPRYRRGEHFEIEQMITHGVDGFITRDVDATRAALQSLLADRALAGRIGKAGRRTAMSYFSPDACTSGWAAVLNRLVAS